MWSFWQGKSTKNHRFLSVFLKIGRFRKVSPKWRQKTSKIIPKLVHNSKSASKRGSQKRVENWSTKKLTFWVQKWSGDPLVKLMCDFEVPKGVPKIAKHGKSTEKKRSKIDPKSVKVWFSLGVSHSKSKARFSRKNAGKVKYWFSLRDSWWKLQSCFSRFSAKAWFESLGWKGWPRDPFG